MRRSHDKVAPIQVSYDSKTGAPKLSHHVSLSDGYYKGKQVFVPKHLKKAMARIQDDNDISVDSQDITSK